jgi:drug/metabolite transporter (DMT)-like permease
MEARPLRHLAGKHGFRLVALGAAIWGSDALFRRGLALELPASAVVFGEHLILVVTLLPFMPRMIAGLRRMGKSDLVALLVVGAGSSAGATILFTHAFVYGDPTTPLLLQKLQPLFAVLGARIVLGERLGPRYGLFFLVALAGAYLITFADPLDVTVRSAAAGAYAVGAAALWGLGTVLGRRLTGAVGFTELTGLRLLVGLPAAGLILTAQGGWGSLSGVGLPDVYALIALALVPGLMALLIYYRGLTETPAASATIAELSFPLTAVVLNWIAFGYILDGTQWVGVLVLCAVIVQMSRLSSLGSSRVGVVAPASRLGGRSPGLSQL